MKFFVAMLPGLLIFCASAYRIDVWDNTDFQGTQRAYTTNGAHNIGFSANSYIWSSAVGDGCCVVFCRGSTNIGKWCQSHSNNNVSGGITKVVTGCGGAVLNC